jgi:diguanylate cyclase (GGDEF)-like protein
MGMDHVWEKFVANNKNFFVYSVLGFLLTAVIFGYLYRVSQQLADAQSTSAHDPLTRLNNRRALDEQMPLLMRESMREQTPLSVMFIDIDHFRKFNELYGHESGDVALQAVANALAGVCQRPRDFICRWGGEEFVVVLPNTTEFAAKQMAQNMLGAIQRLKLRVPHQAPPRLTVSIGHITVIVSLRTLDDDLVGAADQAMLQAKNLGRNQSVMANGTAPHPDNRMRLEPTSV